MYKIFLAEDEEVICSLVKKHLESWGYKVYACLLYTSRLSEEKKITVRKQKIKKNHTKEKLLFFLILTVLLILTAVFAKYLCPYDPYEQDLLMAQKPPSPAHLMGTDRYGRDILSRVITGSTVSIFSTLVLVMIVTALGTGIGIICGWKQGKIDTVLMRISDLFLAFPGLVFALAVAGVLGLSLIHISF